MATVSPALVLCGHVDVVPVGDLDLWPGRHRSPCAGADDAWWGRGACDMKAGVAPSSAPVAAIRSAGVRLARPLAVHTVVGEEDGGVGAFATLRRGHLGDACVIAEPTAGTIVSANAGALTFSLTVTGVATHGSTRTRGVSAIEKFEPVHAALRRLEAERNADLPELFAHLDLGWPLSVGTVAAGDWASTVPDRLVATGRYGVMPGESVQLAKNAFVRAVAAACAQDPWLREHPVEVAAGGMFSAGRCPRASVLNETIGAVTDTAPPRPLVRVAPMAGPAATTRRRGGHAAVRDRDIRFAHASTSTYPPRRGPVHACVHALLALPPLRRGPYDHALCCCRTPVALSRQRGLRRSTPPASSVSVVARTPARR
jgi:acetylornithine deacetylase